MIRLVSLLSILAFWLALPSLAYAHAQIIRSEPVAGARLDSAPGRLRVWFTEPLEPDFSSLSVLDADGKRVDLGDSQVTPDDPTSLAVTLPRDLPAGVYTVSWKTLSRVDGHALQGLFTFSIGAVAPPPPRAEQAELAGAAPLEAALRALQYLAQTALLGSFLLLALVGRDAPQAGGPRLVGRAAALLLLTLSIPTLLLQAVVAGGGESLASAVPATTALLFGTRYGQLWLARFALALLLVGITWRTVATPAGWLAGSVLGAVVLLLNALNSHSAALEGVATIAIGADWLHQVAVSIWVGGLFASAALLLAPSASTAEAPLRRFLPRFSSLALLSVPVLVVSGAFQSLLHLGSWGALLETLYGRALLIKIGLATVMVALGAYHHLAVVPRLQRPRSGPSRLGRRTLLIEGALGALALVAAGLLTALPPGWQTYSQILATRPLTLDATASDLHLSLLIEPGRAGPNRYELRAEDQSRQPLEHAEKVALRFTLLDQNLGQVEVPLQQTAPGVFEARGEELGLAGRWQVEVLVRRRGLDDARAGARFELAAPGATAKQPQPLAALPAPDARAGIAGLVALAGLGLAWYAWRRAEGEVRRAAPGLLASSLVVAAGLVVGARALAEAPSVSSAALTNPFPPDQRSLEIGRRVYLAHCASCHGESGRGDGPLAASLRPPPADFRVHMAAGHTDAQLFEWISKGVPGTAMPAWEDRLSEEERWHVINYIRGFAPQAAQSGAAAPGAG